VLAAADEIVGERMHRRAHARARVDPVDLARTHEGRRAPGVDPLPLDRLPDLLAPQRAQVLQAPVREIAVKRRLDLDPFRVRVLDRRGRPRRADVQDACLERLDGTEVGHAWTIPDD